MSVVIRYDPSTTFDLMERGAECYWTYLERKISKMTQVFDTFLQRNREWRVVVVPEKSILK